MYLMTKSADPDQLASEEAHWSGSTLFEKAGYIWVQQDHNVFTLLLLSLFWAEIEKKITSWAYFIKCT